MNHNRLTWLLAILGSYGGSYLPALWGSAGFTFSSLVCGALGALVGIWLAFKLTR